jgi:hypothetical protein
MDYVDEMVQAYAECLLWAGLDWMHPSLKENGGDENNPPPFDENYDTGDLSDEAWESIHEDCQAFYDYHACILDWVRSRPADTQSGFYGPDQAGHDFYLTRNGHGTGFWDRGLGVLGDILTAGSKPYGETNEFAMNGMIHAG